MYILVIKTVADSKTMTVTGKVVKFVHIYSCSFVCHNLEKNNNLKSQTNPTAADSTNISHKVEKECMHYDKAA